MFIAPSIASLSHQNIRLDCEPEIIRALWKSKNLDELLNIYQGEETEIIPRYGKLPGLRTAKRAAINNMAGFHGIEYLGRNRRTGEDVYYCNAGDPYAATLIFQGRIMRVSCWGHYVENNLVIPFNEI